MRQFKVINTTPDLQSGLTIANFGMPIKLLPESQVTLDKFAAQIDTRNSDIYFATSQTFTVQTYVGGPIYQVTIPAGSYATTAILLDVIRQKTNNVWNAFDDGEKNIGLKFDIQLVNNKVEMSYLSVTPEFLGLNVALDVTAGTASTGTDGIIVADTINGYAYRSNLNTVLQGGGLICEFQFRPDLADGDWSTEAGIFTSDLNQYTLGLSQAAEDPNVFVYTTFPGGIAAVLIPSAVFYPGNVPTTRIVQIYQRNGFYSLQVLNFDIDHILFVQNNIAPFNVLTPTEAYAQSAGATMYVDPTTLPGAGIWIVSQEVAGSLVDSALHTMAFDFSAINNVLNSNALRRGLALPDQVVIQPTNDVAGLYTNDAPIDFSILNAALDIAIELLDMPLDSFIVGDGQFPLPMTGTNGIRQQGGRKNILAYFTPELSTSENVYRFTQSEYQWLDLINKMPLELSSLTFRVFDPTTGRPLNATNLSFNFLIKDKDKNEMMMKY